VKVGEGCGSIVVDEEKKEEEDVNVDEEGREVCDWAW